MKIATWNLNSLRVRLPQVLDWLVQECPDLLALQETKLPDPEFPAAEFAAAGYRALCSGQPAYNGVALLSRAPARLCFTDFPGFRDAPRRVLAAAYGDLRLLNLYVPNGAAVGSEKYAYKLDWLEHLQDTVRELRAHHAHLLVLGDFNIAPDDRDVHDPAAWEGRVLCSPPEREHFRRLSEAGLADCLRLHCTRGGLYSWWDYRAAGFRRNRGLRIDHVLASPALAARCVSCRIDTTPRAHARPSDHAPVIAEFEFPVPAPA